MPETTFETAVVTPERTILEAEATSVVLPAYDGELGVLAHRAPMLARLGAGALRVELADGGDESWFVDGGFAQMVGNRLTILTETAVEPSQLDAADARQGLEEALALPADSPAARKSKERAVASARARLRLAP